METVRHAGRIIGVALIVQMAGSALVNFGLEAPLFEPPGFLVSAASHSLQIGVAALTGLLIESLWVAIAVIMYPIFYQRSRTIALGLFALTVVTLAVAVVENAGVMSMVSLSEAYAKASVVEREHLEAVRVAVASARNWAHYMGRLMDGVAAFAFYVGLYRLELVPRVIAVFGLVTVPMMVSGIVMPFFGHAVVFPLLAPLGFSQLALAVWLLAKGLRDQREYRPLGAR
jgi:Domain of unknown function (DUF4386)